jgi:hypothetical protein
MVISQELQAEELHDTWPVLTTTGVIRRRNARSVSGSGRSRHATMMTRLGQIHQRFAGSGLPGESDQEQMSPATVGLSFWSAGGYQSVRATTAGRPLSRPLKNPATTS